MNKILCAILVLFVTGCGCHCRYNEYLPENNPLLIPEELKQSGSNK